MWSLIELPPKFLKDSSLYLDVVEHVGGREWGCRGSDRECSDEIGK